MLPPICWWAASSNEAKSFSRKPLFAFAAVVHQHPEDQPGASADLVTDQVRQGNAARAGRADPAQGRTAAAGPGARLRLPQQLPCLFREAQPGVPGGARTYRSRHLCPDRRPGHAGRRRSTARSDKTRLIRLQKRSPGERTQYGTGRTGRAAGPPGRFNCSLPIARSRGRLENACIQWATCGRPR